MLNFQSTFLLQSWVKNVYSLCVVCRDTCVRLFTTRLSVPTFTSTMRVKPFTYTHLTTSFTPAISTLKKYQLTPTKSYLSPLSTVPIIRTKKEKIRKDS